MYVTPKIKISNDTTICNGEKAQLSASGAFGNFSWNILSGTPGSLSCTSCTLPQANPSVASSYVAISNNSLCPTNPNYRDTVKVKIHSVTTSHPTVGISVLPDSVIAKDSSVEFRATFQDCGQPVFKWLRNGNIIAGATTNKWITNSINDGDVITCEFSCNDVCSQPRKQNSNSIKMKVLSAIAVSGSINYISVYPNPNNGRFTLQLPATESYDISISNALGQVVYSASDLLGPQQVMTLLPPGLYLLKAANTKDQHLLKIQVAH